MDRLLLSTIQKTRSALVNTSHNLIIVERVPENMLAQNFLLLNVEGLNICTLFLLVGGVNKPFPQFCILITHYAEISVSFQWLCGCISIINM